MKFSSSLVIILALAFLQSAVAQETLDTIWLCRDTTPEVMYYQMFLADTFPDNRDTFNMVDTGDALEGKYVNFNYQFGSPHPGYDGFKFYWDKGNASFYVDDYDSMVLWHKGPLSGHKVQMIWAQGSAGCGTPINYEYLGEYKSSPEWKRESFSFPSGFVKRGLFELRMLIYNDSSTGTTSPTSPPGDLKIDNMFFIKKSAAVNNPKIASGATGGPRYFVPTRSGNVTLTIFSLQGEQLFKESIAVTAGKKYDVSQFARKNSNLPAKWIHCIQITGAGVNITRKMVR
jgi:hypothetical protein